MPNAIVSNNASATPGVRVRLLAEYRRCVRTDNRGARCQDCAAAVRGYVSENPPAVFVCGTELTAIARVNADGPCADGYH